MENAKILEKLEEYNALCHKQKTIVRSKDYANVFSAIAHLLIQIPFLAKLYLITGFDIIETPKILEFLNKLTTYIPFLNQKLPFWQVLLHSFFHLIVIPLAVGLACYLISSLIGKFREPAPIGDDPKQAAKKLSASFQKNRWYIAGCFPTIFGAFFFGVAAAVLSIWDTVLLKPQSELVMIIIAGIIKTIGVIIMFLIPVSIISLIFYALQYPSFNLDSSKGWKNFRDEGDGFDKFWLSFDEEEKTRREVEERARASRTSSSSYSSSYSKPKTCKECKYFFKDVDLPYPVCTYNEFHFEGVYTPVCEHYTEK